MSWFDDIEAQVRGHKKDAAATDVLDPRPLEPVDWHTLFSREIDFEWLVEDFWPKGRQLHVFADRKTGKSLVMLFIAACLAAGRDPFTAAPQDKLRVIYLDYEMSEEDLLERVEEMGFVADDLAELRYYLHPPIPALDSQAGGDALLDLIAKDEATIVVIDTVSRVIAGEENSADTFRALWRFTGARLKAKGVSLARLDHTGHDGTHSRGSSAKADDVDVVWKLFVTDNGYGLARRASRLGWVPESVDLVRFDDPLRFTRTRGAWPAGTAAKAKELDKAKVPLDASVRTARRLLKEKGMTPGNNNVLNKALVFRRQDKPEDLI